MEPYDLCVPIYLNQEIVFNHLAIIEDGFSQFSAVATRSTDAQSVSRDGEGSIGVANVFGFLGIRLGGRYGRDSETGVEEHRATERVHTPTSLFAKLRSYLREAELIKPITCADELVSLRPGDFVEFEGVLRSNPLVSALEAIVSFMELVLPFMEQGQQPGQGGANKGGRRRGKNENEAMVRQLRGVIDGLQSGGALEVIAELPTDDQVKAVLSTKVDYYLDRDTDAIIDGQFRVIGKVVRVLPSADEAPINLLRKTPLGSAGAGMLQPFVEVFREMPKEGLDVPEVITHILGPACQVVPIAIFT